MYALYASGKDAVMGGMLVMGIGYIVYGFIAPRFVAAPLPAAGSKGMSTMMQTLRTRAALRAAPLASLAFLALLALPAAAAGTLDQVRESGKLMFGYRADTRPFAFSDGGKPAGFSVALCRKVADAVKAELKLPALAVEFVPLTAANRFEALQQGRVDLELRHRHADARATRDRRLLDPDLLCRHRRAGARRCRPRGCATRSTTGPTRRSRSGAARRVCSARRWCSRRSAARPSRSR